MYTYIFFKHCKCRGIFPILVTTYKITVQSQKKPKITVKLHLKIVSIRVFVVETDRKIEVLLYF